MRPKELAADDTPGIAPVMHAIDVSRIRLGVIAPTDVTT